MLFMVLFVMFLVMLFVVLFMMLFVMPSHVNVNMETTTTMMLSMMSTTMVHGLRILEWVVVLTELTFLSKSVVTWFVGIVDRFGVWSYECTAHFYLKL